MPWFDKIRSWFGSVPAEQDHPSAPVFDSVKGPKRYFEYFVHKEPDGMVWFEVRAYIPEKQLDGTWVTNTMTRQSPAHSEEIARVNAQRMGREMIGG